LQVTPSDPFSILLVSLALAIALCFMLGLDGVAFIAGLAAATAVFYLFGGFVRTLVATPNLRPRSSRTLAPPAKGLHARHWRVLSLGWGYNP
jgi:hypothetical protein